jgi:gamma-glutamyl-gamma-aminobutyrate hydrolase PuuD
MKKNPIIGIVSRFDIDKMLMNMTKITEIGESYFKVINKYGGIPIGILPVQDIINNLWGIK